MGRKMLAAEAQAAMTSDGLIPYDGLCFECSAARDTREIPALVRRLHDLARYIAVPAGGGDRNTHRFRLAVPHALGIAAGVQPPVRRLDV